jgi:putative endopeptidase
MLPVFKVKKEIPIRFLPRNASAYALLALAPLTAYLPDAPAGETHGIVVADMDRSVKPGDDFYRYANGDWIKRTDIPPDRSEVSAYTRISVLNNERIATLIEQIAKSSPVAGSNASKVADPLCAITNSRNL